jgi:hypothetical protein
MSREELRLLARSPGRITLPYDGAFDERHCQSRKNPARVETGSWRGSFSTAAGEARRQNHPAQAGK